MKLSPVHTAFWVSFLALWAHRSSQSEAETLDAHLCQERNLDAQRYNKSSGQMEPVHGEDVDEIFPCLLYPTNTLNCSWSLPSLPEDSQVSGAVILCEGKKGLPSSKYSSEEVSESEEGVQSKSVVLCRDCVDYNTLSVIVRVNVSQPDVWTVYIKKYKSVQMLEVLSPPPNITALVKDGGLLVTWGQPSGFSPAVSPKCYEYQLDISGQEGPKTVEKWLNYTEPNADPTHTYRVRMRTRKNPNSCRGPQQWSDWSQFVTVGPSEPPYRLNSVVIITISLGIPMILLAVLLFFRLQRVSELLFPPIPRPSMKYKNFLEKTDTFLFSPPAQMPKYEEEITEVEEAE